ncbi:type II secretion system protein N [Limnohabitans sp. DCL3]|uniref:type II secretion system protein N n=1 Tax=Limnohabitans sp. DCL3 TaxID=3374103 RepID=UPI003A8B58FB
MLEISWQRPSVKTVLPLATAAVWALAAAGIAFWVLHMPNSDVASRGVPPVANPQPAAPLDAAMAKALGQVSVGPSPAPVVASSALKLLGVMASPSGRGSALIAVDGQPAQAYRVGQTVQEGWTLVSLTARQAHLKSATAELLLDLPAENKP